MIAAVVPGTNFCLPTLPASAASLSIRPFRVSWCCPCGWRIGKAVRFRHVPNAVRGMAAQMPLRTAREGVPAG